MAVSLVFTLLLSLSKFSIHNLRHNNLYCFALFHLLLNCQRALILQSDNDTDYYDDHGEVKAMGRLHLLAGGRSDRMRAVACQEGGVRSVHRGDKPGWVPEAGPWASGAAAGGDSHKLQRWLPRECGPVRSWTNLLWRSVGAQQVTFGGTAEHLIFLSTTHLFLKAVLMERSLAARASSII